MSTGTTQARPLIDLMNRDKIIPDILPSTPPDLQGTLEIVYPAHVVAAGETVERVITKDTPVVRFTPFPGSTFQSGPENKYSIVMVDSDLTHMNDRLSGHVRHWLLPGLVFSPAAGTEGSQGEGEGGGVYVGKPSPEDRGGKTVTEYLECAPGPPGQYTFLLARESLTSAPQAADFPSAQLTHSSTFPTKTTENLADRAGFDVAGYLSGKGMPVVGVTWMWVGPDAESLVDNVGIMVGTVVDKVMGR